MLGNCSGRSAWYGDKRKKILSGLIKNIQFSPLSWCVCPWCWSPWAAPVLRCHLPETAPGSAAWTSGSLLHIHRDAAAGSRCAQPAGSGWRRRVRSPVEHAPLDRGGPWWMQTCSHRQLWSKIVVTVSFSLAFMFDWGLIHLHLKLKYTQ